MHYFYRNVGGDPPAFLKRRDGEEIRFGTSSEVVDLPNPEFCNLRLAVARVLHASGAAEVVEKYLDDHEDQMGVGSLYFGNKFVPDEVLMDDLFARLQYSITVS